MAELARQFEKPFVGFRAAVAEEHLARPEQMYQRLGQSPLWLGVVEVRDMDELAGLLDQRPGDFRMRVAEATDRDAAAQVEVAASGNIVKVAARTVAQSDVKSRVARDHIFLEQNADGRDLVSNDAGRRWNNFFH